MRDRKPQLTEKELVARIRNMNYRPDHYAEADRPQLGISALCGALEADFPDAARALAHLAGLGFLYENEGAQ